MQRRAFLSLSAITPALAAAAQQGDPLPIEKNLGRLRETPGDPPIPGAQWYEAAAPGDGFSFRFPAGHLASYHSLTSDMLLDGANLVLWTLILQEGEKGRRFRLNFGALAQCSFRMRVALEITDQRSWMMNREGAFLKPLAGGDRVDLNLVDRATLTLARSDGKPVRWCMTPLRASPTEVPRLDKIILPKGPLVDELGQSNLHTWPTRTRDAKELTTRLQTQARNASRQLWPKSFSQWGGWRDRKLTEPAGFFRTHHDGERWWLVDPDGFAFFSNGPNCVRVDCEARVDGIEDGLAFRPDANGEFKEIYTTAIGTRAGARFVNYLAANLIRAFGSERWRERWAAIALAELKRLRCNTVANWSTWEVAAKARFPYVRPMNFRGKRAPMIYRDFPDIEHPGFLDDTRDYASVLNETKDDPAFIGYFLMNEPTWAFSTELPAAGMLYNTETCHTREALARWIRQRHEDDAALAKAWATPAATFDKVARGRWQGILTAEALKDLRAYTTLMVEKYFNALTAACRAADPNHLNLGMRWAGLPPEWAVEGMKTFDVFSLNCYRDKLPRDQSEKIHAMLKRPIMIGEWHFGALDAGLPASGIGHLANQADRTRAYRVYFEDAAANPHCVGAHWFTLYDQSALGRFDGENYNIGFLDICHRPYDELCRGAIASHERLYEVAAHRMRPYDDTPKYLPNLCL
jgi:hypothetical protein